MRRHFTSQIMATVTGTKSITITTSAATITIGLPYCWQVAAPISTIATPIGTILQDGSEKQTQRHAKVATNSQTPDNTTAPHLQCKRSTEARQKGRVCAKFACFESEGWFKNRNMPQCSAMTHGMTWLRLGWFGSSWIICSSSAPEAWTSKAKESCIFQQPWARALMSLFVQSFAAQQEKPGQAARTTSDSKIEHLHSRHL